MSVIKIIAQCLEMDESELKPETQFKNLKNWDSLLHVQIIAEIEDELHVSIPIEQLGQINTVGQLSDAVNERL